ncbi:hypothetical protein WMY93_001977 [Mugilogobius chulae]|uniref:protein-serine/threonine phosphatase n=1 Tax=Mugilogobius chulae TaxID=88201 RepID=A0AAW0PSC7_9GOBI
MHLETSEPAKPNGEVCKLPADLCKEMEPNVIYEQTNSSKGADQFNNGTNNGFLTSDGRNVECEAPGLSQGFDKCECFKLSEPGANLTSASPHGGQHLHECQQCEPDDPLLSVRTETNRLTSERENEEEFKTRQEQRDGEETWQLNSKLCHGTGSEDLSDEFEDFCDKASSQSEESFAESVDADYDTEDVCVVEEFENFEEVSQDKSKTHDEAEAEQTILTDKDETLSCDEEVLTKEENNDEIWQDKSESLDGFEPGQPILTDKDDILSCGEEVVTKEESFDEISQDKIESHDGFETGQPIVTNKGDILSCDDEEDEDFDAETLEEISQELLKTSEAEEHISTNTNETSSSDEETHYGIVEIENEGIEDCLTFDQEAEDFKMVEMFERDSSSDEEESAEDDIGQDFAENIQTDDNNFELNTFSEVAEDRKNSDTSSVNVIFCSEDDSSDCSSRSFQTCPEGSVPSLPSSDSSEVSEKSGQDDSSDEQTQWESFEEEEEVEEIVEDIVKTETKKTVADIVIEDFFDFFDRDDNYGHSQKRHYISCFDGGDVHDRLYYEHLQTKEQNAKNKADSEQLEATEQIEDSCEEIDETEIDENVDAEEEESCAESNFGEQPADFYKELIENGEDALESYLYDDYAEENDSEISSDDRLLEENMSAPCAEDISVEGDAYCDSSEVSDLTEDFEDGFCVSEDVALSACSESEPYCALYEVARREDVGDDVEDYYAFETRSVQTSSQQALRDFLLDAALKESSGILEDFVSDLTERLSQCSLQGKAEVAPPVGLIHSVPESGKTPEESRDSEEEGSEEEPEECDCEYCVPPTEQVVLEPLLPELPSSDSSKMCVVIDLDETLVHSSFKPMNKADFVIPVEIEGTIHQVYVLKRPHVDQFLQRMGELFECVLFTASLSKYADPVSDILDSSGAFTSRLFREACVFHRGNYVKDLSRLGRDLSRVIIIDNSPVSYIFHPDNAVPVASWFDDVSDTELLDLIPFFERLSLEQEVYPALKQQQQQQPES